jgi:hypothetical protein
MMRRRDLLTLLGGAAVAWPVAARAQQAAMPVIGFVRSGTLADVPHFVSAFRQGLKEAGFVEGQNAAIELYSGDNNPGRLSAQIVGLVRRPVAVIVANNDAALAAKTETTSIPIVFAIGSDPSATASSPASIGRTATSRVLASSRRSLRQSSLDCCVSCGRVPRALPCSPISNSPRPSGLSPTPELRLRPLGSKSKSSTSAATTKSRPPLQRLSNVELTRCSAAVAGSSTPVGNRLSR